MMKKKKVGDKVSDAAESFEDFISGRGNKDNYILKLYVSGNSPTSVRAIMNLKKICEENLHGQYLLEIIDLYQKPELAREANLIAAPTLIRNLPLPLRRIIGDMSDTDRVLVGLDIVKTKKEKQ